jgi:hypothetical protein
MEVDLAIILMILTIGEMFILHKQEKNSKSFHIAKINFELFNRRIEKLEKKEQENKEEQEKQL